MTARLAAASVAALLASALHAQAPAAGDVAVSDGTRAYPVARLVDGRLTAGAPCVGAGAPPDPLALQAVVAPVPVVAPRAVQIGSEEWNRLSPLVLALAERREREQRLVQAATSKAPRFIDWLFAADAAAGVTYYFEVSRRVPSVPAPPDVDVDTDPPGTIRIVVSGFARPDAAGLAPLGTKGELRWEQDDLPRGPSRPDLRPLGILSLAGDAIWVMDSRTPAAARIDLLAVGARGTDLLASARIGGC